MKEVLHHERYTVNKKFEDKAIYYFNVIYMIIVKLKRWIHK